MNDKFLWQPGQLQPTVPCDTCAHKEPGMATCVAFPTGIPDDILAGRHQHREPYPGDHGVQYEPVEGGE